MDKKEWLEAREKGLGGSEAPAALGLSRWKTPFQVWKDKRGLSGERESSSAMEWGLLLIQSTYAQTCSGSNIVAGAGQSCPAVISITTGL